MDYSTLPYNPIAERIVDILVTKTQNNSREFFRLQANYYINLVASVMGTKINTEITGTIPINMYGINLGISGLGKTFSTNILENDVIGTFKQRFVQDVFPAQAEHNIALTAQKRCQMLNMSYDEVLDRLTKQFKSYGAFKFMFDSATTPAIKQFRHMLLLADLGAINITIDEIGSNLEANTDTLTTFLELYDKGLVRDKLTKNTDTSVRHTEIFGSTPANIMMFGTPNKLLDGAKTEDAYFEFLDTGYARRCFFAFTKLNRSMGELTPEQLYDRLTDKTQEKDLETISNRMFALASANYCNLKIKLPKVTGIEVLKYRIDCEKRAAALPEHCEIQKAELAHRYFKVLTLAGAYAFIEMKPEISVTHVYQAIRLAEDSGKALEQMFKREKPYERLAKYIAGNKGKQLTQVDLVNELPFYKGAASVKNEMMNSAIAWGYRNNIIIKKSFKDSIEFFEGETLEETNLDKLILSYSKELADKYVNDELKFDSLEHMVIHEGLHWTNHHTTNGHRSEKTMKTGFNLLVLDVDGTFGLKTAMELLKDYTYLMYTTKRHGQLVEVAPNVMEPEDRFRIILPTNYVLELNSEDFATFMQGVKDWCPFEVDTSTFQRSRKWLCNDKAEVYINKGKLFDVLPFIPQTKRYDEYKKSQLSLQSMSNLERWFASQMVEGQRNNIMAQFGFLLMDSGFNSQEIQDKLLDFNSKLQNKLDEKEILSTVMLSIRNRQNHTN